MCQKTKFNIHIYTCTCLFYMYTVDASNVFFFQYNNIDVSTCNVNIQCMRDTPKDVRSKA